MATYLLEVWLSGAYQLWWPAHVDGLGLASNLIDAGHGSLNTDQSCCVSYEFETSYAS